MTRKGEICREANGELRMDENRENRMIRRISTTLPDSLALFVGEVTGEGAPHESPDALVRALLHREMQERDEIRALVLESMNENDYAEWTPSDMEDVRKAATGKGATAKPV